ncbi:MAG: TIGR00374 family protein [Moraxellaceae bacterium]|nr:MAG: TIGR00374 family protein [Moraxellaceae bacterium]
MSRFQRPLFISIIIAIALYFGAIFMGDYQATKDALAKIPLSGWIIILGLSLVNYVLRYGRWDWYIRELSQVKIPLKRHFCYYLAGFALSTTPGKAGETIRSLYLKKHGVSYNQSISSFFVERFLDLITIVLLSTLVAFQFDDYAVLVIIVGLVIFAALPLIHSSWLIDRLNWLAVKVPKFAIGKGHLVKLLNSSTVLLKNRVLYGGLVIGILAWTAEGVGFWLVLEYLGQDVDIALAISIYGIAVLIGALSFLPGGLGSTEAVMGGLLIASGVDSSVAIAATLVCRIATLWFAVFIGLGVSGWLASIGLSPEFSKKN